MNIKSRMKSTRYFVARHAIIKAKLCTDVGESFPVCRGDKGRTSTRRLRFILDKKRSYKAIRAACASESRNSQLFTKNFKVNTKSLGFERAQEWAREHLCAEKDFLARLACARGTFEGEIVACYVRRSANRWQLMGTGRNQSHNKGLFFVYNRSHILISEWQRFMSQSCLAVINGGDY